MTHSQQDLNDQTYSFGLKFQRALIKEALNNVNWFISNHVHFKSEYFKYSELIDIANIIHDFYDNTQTTPTEDVLSELVKKHNNKKSLIVELTAIKKLKISQSEKNFIFTGMKQFSMKSIYESTIYGISESLDTGKFDNIPMILDKALRSNFDSDDSYINYFNDDNWKDRYTKSVSEKIPTLVPTFDKKTRGGVSKKELAMLLAPPYRGKSAGLVQLGTNALFSGKNVLHITVEMSDDKTAIRYDSSLTAIPYEKIVKNFKAFRTKVNKFKSLYRGSLIIKEFPSRGLTVVMLKEFITFLARSEGFITDLLVLDYVDEMKRPNIQPITYAIGEVVSELRGMCTELNLACWTASQTTRAGFSKPTIDMDDMADSWDKAKISDIIVAMCQTKQEEVKEEMRLILIKNRDNKRFSKPIYVTTNFDIMRLKEN